MSPTGMVPCSESHFTSAGFNVASSGNMAQILQFDKVLSQAPIGIALMDEEGVYEDVNAAYSHLYGYRQDELIGQSVTRIFLPAEHARVLALHRSFLEEGKALPGTWQAVRQDGTRISIKSVSIRIEGNDGKPRRLVFVTDVTKNLSVNNVYVQVDLSECND
jgi:PAS domain S-box-containing protein